MSDTNPTDKISFLEEVNQKLNKYDDRKDVSRAFAVGLRLASTLLGASITVLLGWKHNGATVEVLTNFALICGGVISVLSGIDTFFSFSHRWTHYKEICTQLIFLKNDAEREPALDGTKLEVYNARLSNIIIDARRGELDFHKHRQQTQSK